MLQFSIRTLLLAAVVVAIGCTGLVHPTEIWRQAVVTMTVVILLISTLAAIFGQGNLRATAGGFAVAGWMYFLLAFAPSLNIREHLLTSHVLGTLDKVIHGESVRLAQSPAEFVGLSRTSYENFYDIGHMLWTLTVGVVGSFAAGWFSQQARQDP